MDLKDELKESVAEAKNAKATQNAWVFNARKEASDHEMHRFLWIILIVVSSLSIAGLYTDVLWFVTDFVSSILGWIGLENYTLHICIVLIIVGVWRIWTHTKERNERTQYANQIESMSLTKFRHTYM